MKVRSSYIDIAKFAFAIIIALGHFGLFFYGGYVAVEAFFMISGYFLMCSVIKESKSENAKLIGGGERP